MNRIETVMEYAYNIIVGGGLLGTLALLGLWPIVTLIALAFKCWC